MISVQVKDPQAVLDYGLDWRPWLKQWDGTTDSIVSASWAVDGPDNTLVIDSEYLDTDVTGVWLSGGTVGEEYGVTCSITTTTGRKDDRTIKFRIRQR